MAQDHFTMFIIGLPTVSLAVVYFAFLNVIFNCNIIRLSSVASVISLVSFEGGESQIIFGKQKHNRVYIYVNKIIVRNYL